MKEYSNLGEEKSKADKLSGKLKDYVICLTPGLRTEGPSYGPVGPEVLVRFDIKEDIIDVECQIPILGRKSMLF